MTETERVFAEGFSRKDIHDFVDDVLFHHSNQSAESIRMSDRVYEQLGRPPNYKGIRIDADGQLWPDNVVQVLFRT
jgi:hypothetical protein